MAQIKVRNSANSAWAAPKAVKVWNGSAWVQRVGYRWTGSAWDKIIQYAKYFITGGSLGTYTVAGNVGTGATHGSTGGYYHLSTVGTDEEDSSIWLRSVQSVDITSYSTLYMDVDTVGINSLRLGIVTAYPATLSHLAYKDTFSKSGRETLSISVSSLTGDVSFFMSHESTVGTSGTVKIYNMWLA